MPRETNPTFFVDASLGRRVIPHALRSAGVAVVAHDDVFAPATLDEVWLQRAGREGWIVITKDKRIRYRAIEKRALESAGVGAFVLTAKNLTGEEMAAVLVGALPAMLRFNRKHTRPWIAVVTMQGTIRAVV